MTASDEQPLGLVLLRRAGEKTHFCVSCSFPISVFGRLHPCLHSFCLACASEMDTCFLCQASISRLERWPRENGLYVSPATLQSFRSEDELISHTKRVYQHLMGAVQAAERKQAAAAAAARQEKENVEAAWREKQAEEVQRAEEEQGRRREGQGKKQAFAARSQQQLQHQHHQHHEKVGAAGACEEGGMMGQQMGLPGSGAMGVQGMPPLVGVPAGMGGGLVPLGMGGGMGPGMMGGMAGPLGLGMGPVGMPMMPGLMPGLMPGIMPNMRNMRNRG